MNKLNLLNLNFHSKFFLLNTYLRIFLYFFLWQLYIQFMSSHAPLGTSWIEWHYLRSVNLTEFLKFKGYFSHYGFSISTTIKDAYLNIDHPIYLSTIAIISSWHYFIIHYFFEIENLKLYGQMADKAIIFITGCLFSELYFHFLKRKNLKNLIKVFFIFFIFTISPWTYKMIIFPWTEIHFVLFYLIGILLILKKKHELGLISIFFSALTNYVSAAGIAFFYIFLIVLYGLKKKKFIHSCFFIKQEDKLIHYKIVAFLILPIFLYFFLRLLISDQSVLISGSSLLRRIGISGNDLGNGTLLGALQFFGGNRISVCFDGFGGNLKFTSNLLQLIPSYKGSYNCILSILSMFLVSVMSIFGLYISYKRSDLFFNLIIIPFLFIKLSTSFILQEYSSVHLMGNSYIFSFLFSFGLTNLFFKILEKNSFSVLSLVLTTPFIIGIILLCIRISMLTGING